MEENVLGGYSLKKGEGARLNFRGTSMTMKVMGKWTEGA